MLPENYNNIALRVTPLTSGPGRIRVRFGSAVAASALFVLVFAAPFVANAQQQAAGEAARFQLADTYLRAGQFDRAIALLEDLYEDNDDYAFFAKLLQAYENSKRYDRAIALVDSRIPKDANPVNLLAEKARFLYLDERLEEAEDVWGSAIEVAPANELTYRIVYQSLADVREFERAVDVLTSARVRLKNDKLFQRELGHLYGMVSEHGLAMQEYLGLLEDDPRQLASVKTRISRFASQAGVVKASVEVAEKYVRKNPLNRTARELLGWLYLESELYQPALNTYRAIDRLASEQGRVLFVFAGQAAAAGEYAVALEAYDEILSRYAASPVAAEAVRGIGETHARWGAELGERPVGLDGERRSAPHYAAARAAYERFVQDHANNPILPYVKLELGRLQQEVFLEYDLARATYREVISAFPNHAAADESAFQIGRLLITQGKLDDARVVFSRLEERLRTGDLAEEARYEIALVHFYQGDFEAARSLVSALKENTSNDTANNAIELRVVLLENQGPDSLSTPLRVFADAMLLHRQHRQAASLERLDELLSEHGGHKLVDDVQFQKATILKELERFEEAYQLFAELPLHHPSSFLADRSLFQAAILQDEELGNPEKAIEILTRLLTEYPGSLLASRARERIRLLRGDNV